MVQKFWLRYVEALASPSKKHFHHITVKSPDQGWVGSVTNSATPSSLGIFGPSLWMTLLAVRDQPGHRATQPPPIPPSGHSPWIMPLTTTSPPPSPGLLLPLGHQRLPSDLASFSLLSVLWQPSPQCQQGRSAAPLGKGCRLNCALLHEFTVLTCTACMCCVVLCCDSV